MTDRPWATTYVRHTWFSALAGHLTLHSPDHQSFYVAAHWTRARVAGWVAAVSVVLAADAYAISGSERHPDSAGTTQNGKIIQLFSNPAPPQPTCKSCNNDRQPAATVDGMLELAKALGQIDRPLLVAALRHFADEIVCFQQPGRFRAQTLRRVAGVRAVVFGAGPVLEAGTSRLQPSTKLAGAAPKAFEYAKSTRQPVVVQIHTDAIVRHSRGLGPAQLAQTLIVAPTGWKPDARVRVPEDAMLSARNWLSTAWTGGLIPHEVLGNPTTLTMTHKPQTLEGAPIGKLLGRRLGSKLRSLRVLPISQVTAWQPGPQLVRRHEWSPSPAPH